ncbi:MAG: hypothetical protein Q9163_002750 [Psora crenata]
MLRTVALQTRVMTPVFRRRGVAALHPWSNSQQSRQKSTCQEISSHDVERTAAILHGRQKHKGERTPKKISDGTQILNRPTSQQTHLPAPNTNSKRRPAQSSLRQSASRPNSKLHGHGHTKSSLHQSTSGHYPQVNGNGSKKRKAESPLERPGARRSRHEQPKLVLKDEAYIRRTMHVPTSQDYPDAPKGIFKTPKQSIMDGTQGLATVREDFTELAEHIWRCTLTFDSASHKEVVEAEGRSKKSAETAAYLHFIAKCHELGILMEIIDRKSSMNQTNKQIRQQVKQEEKDAIIDIYNYAARFDTVPKFNVRAIKRMERRRLKTVIEMDIDLSEQAIHVKGFGRDRQSAEIDAALKFKKEAEKYHAQQGNKNLIIKDSTALTADNTAKYIEFIKIIRPGIQFDIEHEQQKITRGQDHHRAQVKVNKEPVGDAIVMSNKKKAEATALLTACVELKKQDPESWPRYLRALQHGNGQILRPIAPLDMKVDEDCSLVMRETLLGARKAGLPDEVEEPTSMDASSEGNRRLRIRRLYPDEVVQRSQLLIQQYDAFQQDPEHAELRQKKAELPMNQYRSRVLELVNNNMYSIIVGATGSGKTTQVPQILLENAISQGNGAACNIICTQPRRIAATSVARRVAAERAERLQESVGYHVRFDAKPPKPGGSINYCTTGILLQQLQHYPDEIMDNTSHLVIDEVHERDILIDFLLILVRRNILRRKALGKSIPNVVLMSATMDTELFAGYFKVDVDGQQSVDCPSLSVPGRTFPVRERYIDEILQDMTAAKTPMRAIHHDPNTKRFLEAEDSFRKENRDLALRTSPDSLDNDLEDRSVIDWRRERKISSNGEMVVSNEKEDALVPFGLIVSTVAHIAKATDEGAILVFLPGLEEIVRVEGDLKSASLDIDLTDSSRFKVYMLHSSITATQQTIFEPVPEGCRKIILSTNIAETSVTIPDVQHVIDAGKLREKQYDQTRRITTLACTWISKSNSKQRAGRAGRVQHGNYYALFSKERYDSLRAIGLPELLRTDLQEICLDIKAQAFDTPIREFLAEAIEPPSQKFVDTSVINLQALDALTEDERITPLGRLLAALPVHPSLGKMIVLGIIFRCLDPMLILGAASAERPLFLNPLDARAAAAQSKLSFVEGSGSDHIALLNAVRELRHWRDTHGEAAMRDFAHQHFLHVNGFRTIDSTVKQIEEILVQSGIIPYTPGHNRVDSQYGNPSLNANSHKSPLIKALLLAGLHPNLAVTPRGNYLFRTPGEKNVLIHPSSTNASKDLRPSKGKNLEDGIAPGTLYSYSSLAKSNDGGTLYMRDTTESTPLMASLFGGKLRRHEERGNIIEIDNWLPFYVVSPDRRTAKTIIEFRKALERLLAVAFKELGTAAKGRKMGEQRSFLADEKIRTMFAAGLVEVLDRDVKVSDSTRQRGWAPTPRQSDTPKRNTHAGSQMPGFYNDVKSRYKGKEAARRYR